MNCYGWANVCGTAIPDACSSGLTLTPSGASSGQTVPGGATSITNSTGVTGLVCPTAADVAWFWVLAAVLGLTLAVKGGRA